MNLKGEDTIHIRFRETETDSMAINVVLNGNNNRKQIKMSNAVSGVIVNFRGDDEVLMSSSTFKSYVIR